MKRKNLLLILVAALVLSAFFVACKADIEAPSGELVDVTFAMDGSRALSATLEDFDPGLYYWKYAAAKNAADTSGLNSGATEGYNDEDPDAREAGALWIHEGEPGLSGTVPGFSQGLWDFTLYAYTKEGTAESPVYSLTYLGEAKAVSLVKSVVNKVHVVVSPAPEGNGKLYIGETTLNPKKPGDIPSVSRFLKVEDFDGQEYAPTSGTTYILPAGTYRVTVTYKASGITYADGMVIATVYPNMTTTVTGSVDELVTYAQFEAEQNPDIITRTAGVDGIHKNDDVSDSYTLTEKETAPEDVKVTATVPAAAAKNLLPKDDEGEIIADAYMSLLLNVDTTDSTSTSVTYEINMTKIVTLDSQVETSDVTDLGMDDEDNKYYATAIVKLSEGLTGVRVTHSGEEMVESDDIEEDEGNGIFYYDPETGILTIITNTFCPFAVTYDGQTAGVAEVNGEKYATLKAAVEAAQSGDTVKLLSDAEGAGMSINKSITIDFNGKTYTGTKEPAGSTGTQSQLFQLLGGTIVMKNGTLSSVSGSGIKMLVNNYSDLTLNSMTLDGTNLDDSNVMYYTLSCNKGDVVITGNTIIIAHSDNGTATGKAFDVWGPYGGGGNRTVTFDEYFTGKVKGVIEYTAAPAGRNAQLIIKAGDFSDTELTIDGTLSDESFISIMGGVFGWNPWKYVADGYEAIYNPSTGLWTVSEIPGDGVAKIGTVYYNSLQAAITDAESGETVELLRDITSNAVLEVVDDVTIEGNYKTVKYASMTTSLRALWIDADDVTLNLKNLTLDGNNVCERGVQVNNGEEEDFYNADITIDNCKLINFTYYTINLCSASTVELLVKNSYVSGYAAINAYGSGTTITVVNSVLEGKNDKGYSAWNNFSTICLEGDTTLETDMHSSDYQVTVIGSTIKAIQSTGNKQSVLGFNKQSVNSKVIFSDCTFEIDEGCNLYYNYGTGHTLIINGVKQFTTWNADFSNLTIDESIPNGFVTLTDAWDELDTVEVLIKDCEPSEWESEDFSGVDYTKTFTNGNCTYLFDLDVSADAYEAEGGYHLYLSIITND